MVAGLINTKFNNPKTKINAKDIIKKKVSRSAKGLPKRGFNIDVSKQVKSWNKAE